MIKYEVSGTFKLVYREPEMALPSESFYKDITEAMIALEHKENPINLYYIPAVRGEPIVTLWSSHKVT